jgi:hypothetical protein
MNEDDAFSDWWGFSYEQYSRLQDKEQQAAEERLRHLMNLESDIRRASERAIAGAVTSYIPWTGECISVPAELIGRLWKNEPRPLLARLLSRRSDYVLQVLVLTWLRDLEPWSREARNLRWDWLLPLRKTASSAPIRSTLTDKAGTERKLAEDRRTQRSALRALEIITSEVQKVDSEMSAWMRSNTEQPKLAWVTPRRPESILIRAEFFANGWHLALSKSELAWWLAGRLVSRGKPTERLRQRYLGFSKHVTGTAWLSTPTVLDVVDTTVPAVSALSRLLLETLGSRARWSWPRVEFSEGEYPLLVVRGKTRTGHEAVIIATNQKWHPFETSVDGNHIDPLARVEGIYPNQKSRPTLACRALYDSVKKTFSIFAPGKVQVSDPLFTSRDVAPSSIWGDDKHFLKF